MLHDHFESFLKAMGGEMQQLYAIVESGDSGKAARDLNPLSIKVQCITFPTTFVLQYE